MVCVSQSLRFAVAVLGGVSALLAAAVAAEPLQLEGEDVFRTDKVEAQLLSEVASVIPGEPFRVALHLKIRPHWHTYWRFSGDSGAATTIDWSLPDGFTAAAIDWPAPSRVPLGPLMNYGYEGEAVHFVTITPPADLEPGRALPIAAAAEWLVCDDEMCIPEYGKFRIGVTAAAPGAQARRDPAWGLMTGDAARTLPEPAPFSAGFAVKDGTLQIQIASQALGDAAGADADLSFYPYEDGILKHAAPQAVAAVGGRTVLSVPASYQSVKDTFKGPLHGLLVAEGEGRRRAFDVTANLAPALDVPVAIAALDRASPGAPEAAGMQGPPKAPGAGPGFLLSMAGAFLGGLILNLMPCVFPVLSMKALGFARKAHAAPAALRREGWAFTAGVLASFLVLAGVLLAVRAGGGAAGWGYQLQSPIVVLILAYLMFLVGLSLSGMLSIGGSFSGIGGSLAAREGLPGAFFTGVLATLVASPCTAPFMGAALGYALMQPAYVSLAVFLALGFGLAAPYLVLAHVPAALAWLPKPGPWMERLKEFFAFPMFATAAWLIWVMAQQTGPDGLFGALIGLVLIAFAVWVFRAASPGRSRGARAAGVLALIAAAGVAAMATQASTPTQNALAAEGVWEPFSNGRLADARAAGRGVFVDFTAAWCVTCKVNEMAVLSTDRIEDAFEAHGVVALRGDWTNRNPEISAMLESYDRIGVPLYLYFAPGAQTAVVLPQILSEAAVLAALGGEGQP